jgi:hypothetical protein
MSEAESIRQMFLDLLKAHPNHVLELDREEIPESVKKAKKDFERKAKELGYSRQDELFADFVTRVLSEKMPSLNPNFDPLNFPLETLGEIDGRKYVVADLLTRLHKEREYQDQKDSVLVKRWKDGKKKLEKKPGF